MIVHSTDDLKRYNKFIAEWFRVLYNDQTGYEKW